MLDSPDIPEQAEAAPRAQKAGLNAFALKAGVDRQLRETAALRRPKVTVQGG